MTFRLGGLLVVMALWSSQAAADGMQPDPPLDLYLPGGYDEPFCNEIPGFSEDYVIAIGIGKDWLLTDCSDGTSAYMRIVDEGSGLDIFDVMIRYRDGLLHSDAKPTFAQITSHMKTAGATISYFNYGLTPEDMKTRCTPVAQPEPCTSIKSLND